MNYDDSNPFAKILRGELPCIKVAESDAADICARIIGGSAFSERLLEHAATKSPMA